MILLPAAPFARAGAGKRVHVIARRGQRRHRAITAQVVPCLEGISCLMAFFGKLSHNFFHLQIQ